MRISDWSSDVCSSDLAPRHLAAQSAPRRRQQRAGVLAAGLFVGAELKAVEAAHELALDQHLAVLAHGADEGAFAAQAAHQDRCAAVDEALREALMQGIRQGVLDGPRPALPVGVVVQPVAAVGNVGPGARSEEHTSELQSLMRISYAVLCL